MERQFGSIFENVVRGTEWEKNKVKKQLTEWFENDDDEEIRPYELEKTPEDIKLINDVDSSVNLMVAELGGIAKPIPPANVHLVLPGSVYKITNGELSSGYHSVLGQRVVVEKVESKIYVAAGLAHELFHLKSYKAAQVNNGEAKPYRSGIKIYGKDNDETYFDSLEEAIVAKMEAKFYNGLLRDMPLAQPELQDMDLIREWMKKMFQLDNIKESDQQLLISSIYSVHEHQKIAKLLRSEKDDTYKIGYLAGALKTAFEKEEIWSSGRHEEVERLEHIIQDILHASNGQFKDTEEIFRIFAQANFSGRILTLAKTIEKYLGKGSFRVIAEDKKNS